MNKPVIVHETKIEGKPYSIEFKVRPQQIYSISTLMALAGIDHRKSDGGFGWSWDSIQGSVLIILPYEYRTSADIALNLIREKFYPEFLTGLEIKAGI